MESILRSIFYQTGKFGYINLPIEKMAGLLLYRIAEGQCFANGNKRTALLSANFFLFNNGYTLFIDKGRMNDLLWGFARDEKNPDAPPRYTDKDAIQYIVDNIMIRLSV